MQSEFHAVGFIPPAEITLGEWVVEFCPAVMAKATAGLDDEALHHFLDTVIAVCDLHIIHYDVSLAERTTLTDEQLNQLGPASLKLLRAVQAEALA